MNIKEYKQDTGNVQEILSTTIAEKNDKYDERKKKEKKKLEEELENENLENQMELEKEQLEL